MNKYLWKIVQAAEFTDGTIDIENGTYRGCNIDEVLDGVREYNERRNDGFVGSKILGIKITGLKM